MGEEGGQDSEVKKVEATPYDQLYGGEVKPEDLKKATEDKFEQTEKQDGEKKEKGKEESERQLNRKELSEEYVKIYTAFLRKIHGSTVVYNDKGQNTAELVQRGWQIDYEDDGSYGGYNSETGDYFNVSADRCRLEVGTSGGYNRISNGVIEGNFNDVIIAMGDDPKKAPLNPRLTHRYLELLKGGKSGITFDYRSQSGEFDKVTGKGTNFKDSRPPQNSNTTVNGIKAIVAGFK